MSYRVLAARKYVAVRLPDKAFSQPIRTEEAAYILKKRVTPAKQAVIPRKTTIVKLPVRM